MFILAGMTRSTRTGGTTPDDPRRGVTGGRRSALVPGRGGLDTNQAPILMTATASGAPPGHGV